MIRESGVVTPDSVLYVGPMRSGKSAQLIRDISKLERDGIRYVCVKSASDTRDGRFIKSRDSNLTPVRAVQVIDSSDILSLFGGAGCYECVVIDEVFLFDGGIIGAIEELISMGVGVICAGLDTDFRGEWFPLIDSDGLFVYTMADLMLLMERVGRIERLKAPCYVCGKDGDYTQRLVNGVPASYDSPVVVIGDSEYQSCCFGCHSVPGRPW